MTTGTDSRILKRLEAWEGKKGSLPRTLEFYRRLLRIQSEARLSIGAPRLGMSPEIISNRMMAGHPLLEFDDLLIDWPLMRDTLEEVTNLVVSYSEVLGEVPENLKNLSSSLALLKEIAKTWFKGTRFSPRITVSGIDEDLMEFMIHAALKPFLVSHCELLLSFVDQEQWRRGYCPVCGGNPDFAFLDKERGARWLICTRCDADWLFQRLECPYCGNQDQNTLAYFTDDKEVWRLYVCEKCRHYLKAVDLRRAEYEVLFPLERFLTIDIDTQAHKQGYTPGAKARQGETMKRQGEATFIDEGGKLI